MRPGYDNCQLIDVTGALEIFAYAAEILRERYSEAPPFYSVEILAEHHGPLASSSGIKLLADRIYRNVGDEIDRGMRYGYPALHNCISD